MALDNGASPDRPIILGRIASSKVFKPPGGGKARARFTDPERRSRRIDSRFEEAIAALDDQVKISESIHATDPQLVLVFEALDERIDLSAVAAVIGLEVLAEAEGSAEPDEEVELISLKAKNPIGSCLHAICANQTAFDRLLSLWRKHRKGEQLPHGMAKLRDFFDHLKDVRPWGPQDRLGEVDWAEYFEGRIDEQLHTLEIELWYRQSERKRRESQEEVTALIEQAGGRVTAAAIVDQVGYHGLKCAVPTAVLRNLAGGNHDAVRLVRTANVMYLRVSGQALPEDNPLADVTTDVAIDLPLGDPVLCLLDGVPATNHPILRGRVQVYDPDELQERAAVDEMRHGTWMSSVAVWGDLGDGEVPASRPVLVRPILTPAADTTSRTEELPADALVPDLMWRVFRELFDGTPTQPPAGRTIAIVSLSVGDPASPFDTIMSAWARMIDWLSYQYGILVIVSAGNHRALSVSPVTSSEIVALTGTDRRRAVLEAIERQQNKRRLLAPAESVNAIAVGALHADASGAAPRGYAVDPADGLTSISPISPTGTGYRRSVKPDLAANGGRVFFTDGFVPQDTIGFKGISPLGPGIRVATPSQFRETHISGTSPAAALIAKRAARLHDVVEQVTAGVTVTERQRASAIKALLVHGASMPNEDDYQPLRATNVVGNGAAARDLADGCSTNEAVMLFVGTIGANEEQELLFPLPDGLNVREAKRIDATLAWLSPVNWRHRQYRRASLSFVKPGGAIPKLSTPIELSADEATRGAATVQHLSWELQSAFASGQGSTMSVRLKCTEQAGGLGGSSVDFAVALSLWVAPTLGVDVYNQVRTQVRPRIQLQPQG